MSPIGLAVLSGAPKPKPHFSGQTNKKMGIDFTQNYGYFTRFLNLNYANHHHHRPIEVVVVVGGGRGHR